MLVLSRKPGTSVMIGPDIRVTVVVVEGKRVRLGIEAPQSVQIIRKELLSPDSDEGPVGTGPSTQLGRS